MERGLLIHIFEKTKRKIDKRWKKNEGKNTYVYTQLLKYAFFLFWT